VRKLKTYDEGYLGALKDVKDLIAYYQDLELSDEAFDVLQRLLNDIYDLEGGS